MWSIKCAVCKNKHTADTSAEALELVRQCQGASRPAFKSSASSTPPAPEPKPQPPSNFPVAMLQATGSGYFAVRQDDNDDFTFYRISKAEKGKWAGTIKVQSIHGDRLNLVLLHRPSNGWLKVYDQRFIQKLLFVLADPFGSGLNYSREIDRCCKCGKQLTDTRSRHYSIGPECEKRFPDHIAMVDARNERDSDA
jgi:Family of unknown function (DUF6011)